MATTTARQFRYFRNHYQCDACPGEWSDEMPVVCFACCPTCDEPTEPYDSEAMLEDAADEEEV